MISVGEKLRTERVRQGMNLSTLAANLRISEKYLQAIESDTPQNLPGGFFYRSFVRQVAIALKMNATELESDLDNVRQAEQPILSAALQATQFPLKTPDPIVMATNERVASGRTWAYVLMLVGVLVGCSAFYAWWHRLESAPADVQARSVPFAAPDVRTPPPAIKTVAAAETPAPPEISAPAAALPVVELSTSPDDKVVLTFSAKETTWVSVSADGKPIFMGTLAPSQTKVLGSKARAYIRVGNAGGVEITWNGKPIGPIGPHGQVRNAVFTQDKYQVIPVGGSL
jgi:cytoskeleton protein RodZ